MLRAASTPAGISIVPIAFWPRAAVAVPTVKVARSWAAARLNKTDTNMAAVIERDIDCLRSNDFGDSYRLSSYRRGSRRTSHENAPSNYYLIQSDLPVQG